MLDGKKAQAVACLGRAKAAMLKAGRYCVAHGNRGVYRGWFTLSRVGGMDYQRLLTDMQKRLAGRKLTKPDAQWLQRRLTITAS
jgi:hypothetical protein